jgi:glycosyltransferase involved in cell wall biosynthesis
LTLPRYLGRLRRAIRSFAPDIIHTNGLKMHVLAGWATPSIPVVWHLHDYLGSRPLTTALLRRSTSHCAAIVANSMSVANDAREAIGRGVKVVPIYNAVDLDRFSPSGDRLDLDRLAGLPHAPEGTIRVGLLGTFARWKGHETFLRAVAELPRELPVRAYVIGDALYQTDGSQYSGEELRRVAASLGLAERVGFTGFVNEADAALRALDIVVHASTMPEPFGLVIAEAMACGRAVIVSRAGGAAELVSHDVDALTHTPGKVGDLAARIAALAADGLLRARLGAAARARAERQFDHTRLAREIVPVYESAVGSRLSALGVQPATGHR